MSSQDITPGTSLSDVKEHQLHWLWNKRIPRGKLTLLDGDPDLGKSLITLDLAARVTTGQPMPDGSPGITGNVILIAPEDDAADTIKPRILAAGGDPSRIRLLTMLDAFDPRTQEPRLTPFTLPTHLATLISSVQHFQAVLVIIDPLIAMLDPKVSVSNEQQMRNVLVWLDRLACHDNCAILLVRHLTKSSSANALHRGSGSVGIIASVRSSLLVVRDPYDEQKRILTVIKNNLSTRAPDLTYHITSHASGSPTIHWLGTSSVPLPTLLKNSSELSAGRQAILNVLRQSALPLSPKDIAERTGLKYEPVKVVLRRMVADKDLLNPAYGLYTLLGHPSLNTPPPQEQATPKTPKTPETVDTLVTLHTPNTPVTPESMSDLASHVSDPPETSATVVTLVTLEPISDRNSHLFDAPATVNDFDSHVSDVPETHHKVNDLNSHTSNTLVTLEAVSDLDSHISATLDKVCIPDSHASATFAIVNDLESYTSVTPATLATLATPGQTPLTPPLDLDTTIKKIRTLFSCSHDIHYLHWLIFAQKIGCPICDNWLVRDSIYNPTTLALYEILNHYPPQENEHRRTWLERIVPFIP